MARRAKIGQRPKVQQSITGLLVSIAREMQATQDRNIMDAWKNGGEFEGKPVTDEQVLAHWEKRLQNLDKDDPLYDTYRDQVLQLTYGIEQSKQDLLYVQGKISDSQYAKFFLDWSKKVPKNSEWWRTLQKDAARLLENAKAKGRASAGKRKTDAFNAFVADQNKDIDLGNALTDAIQSISKETGLGVTANGDELLGLLTEDFAANPDKYRQLGDAIAANGGYFNGTFTHEYVANSINNAEDSYGRVADRAKKDGYASAYNTATKGQSTLSSWASNLEVWDVATAYDRAYKQFSKVWNDPNASYMDKNAAALQFSATATNLSKSPGIDIGTKTMLEADAARAAGEDAGDHPSFGPAMLGHAGIDGNIQNQVAATKEAEALMAANPGAYVYAPVDQNGSFDATGQGAVGIVPASVVPSNAIFIAQPGLGGQARMVAIQPKSILVNDPNDPKAPPTAIGSFVSYQVGGSTVSLYGYNDADGKAHWSMTPFTADGVTGGKDKDGNLVLTLPGSGSPAARAQQIDAQFPGLNLSAQVSSLSAGSSASGTTFTRDPSTGKVTGKVVATWDGTEFSVKQTTYSYDPQGRQIEGATTTVPIGINTAQDLQIAATAPSRWTGGDIGGVTFDSPAAASVAATAGLLSSNQIASLSQDPAFQHAFLTQTMQTLGTQNPLDPRVAEAWRGITGIADGKPQFGGLSPDERSDPRVKAGLTYPGAEPAIGTTTLDINFGKNTLKVPGLPAYLNNAQGQAPVVDASGVFNFLKGAASFADSLLNPGQVPGGAKPTGTGASLGVIGPAKQPDPVSIIAPKPTVSSVPAPTPIAEPTLPGLPPSPLVRPGGGMVAS